jgi:hypothetical protein
MLVGSLVRDRGPPRPSLSYAETIALLVRSLRDIALDGFESRMLKLEVLCWLYCCKDVAVIMTGHLYWMQRGSGCMSQGSFM